MIPDAHVVGVRVADVFAAVGRVPAAGAACQPVPALSTPFVVDSAVLCEVEAPPMEGLPAPLR